MAMTEKQLALVAWRDLDISVNTTKDAICILAEQQRDYCGPVLVLLNDLISEAEERLEALHELRAYGIENNKEASRALFHEGLADV